MRPRRITDAQIAHVIDVTTRRRAAYEKFLREFPTNAQLAKELNCCQRVIDRIVAGEYSVPRGTSLSPTELDEYARQLGGSL